MRRATAMLVASGVLVLLAACGGQKPQATSGGQTGGAASGAIVIEATEFAYSPKQVTTSASTKTFELRNKGTIEHDFMIDALNIDTGIVAPGASKSVSGEVRSGTYEFYCSIPGHKEAGMVGTLTVS